MTDFAGGPRHEATERIIRLIQLLTANECTRKEIFQRLASLYKIDEEDFFDSLASNRVNRAFERDLKFLEEMGFEVKRIRKRAQPARYSIVRGSGPRVSFLFAESEVESLALLYNLFADPTRYSRADITQPLPPPLHAPFADQILKLIERLAATLPPEQGRRFDRLVRKPYLYFNLAPVTDYLPHQVTIEKVIQAISLHQRIRFDYMPTHRKREVITHENIDPYYVIYMEGHFYLIGYNHKMGRFLEYRVDRIKEESLQIQPEMIDVERRRHPVEFRFWIESKLVKGGLSQRWLTQTLEREEVFVDENGREHRRTLIRATAYNEWRVIQQLLRYGDQAELVEPPHLREKMQQIVRRMYRFYRD
ncbi:MAG: WYL domain-containing protein [Ktedonobacteraceae bacterium]|nr:WYL domain-containing protein [Ktedonobacteraceae bacterium]